MARYCESYEERGRHLWVMMNFTTRDEICYYCNLAINEKDEHLYEKA